MTHQPPMLRSESANTPRIQRPSIQERMLGEAMLARRTLTNGTGISEGVDVRKPGSAFMGDAFAAGESSVAGVVRTNVCAYESSVRSSQANVAAAAPSMRRSAESE